MGDLFTEAARERQAENAPLAVRLRPSHARRARRPAARPRATGSALRLAIEEDRPPSMILFGPPGTGKTTIARIVAERTGADVRGALRRLGARRRRARRDRARPRPPRRQRPADDPLHRRDPPLQQGAAGLGAARGRGRARDADRRDDREPVLRGELGAALALHGRSSCRRSSEEELVEIVERGAAASSTRTSPPKSLRSSPRGRAATRGPLSRSSSSPWRPPGAEGAHALRGARARRLAQAPAPLRPQGRPALRLRVGLHQVDARRRRRRDRLLPRGDARGGRGSALHRPPHGHPRLRGRRQRRPERARGRRRRGAGARARRPARGAAQPRAGGDLPRTRAEVERLGRRDLGGAPRRARARERATAGDAPLDRPQGRAPRRAATARATSTRTTTRPGSSSRTFRRSCADGGTIGRPERERSSADGGDDR